MVEKKKKRYCVEKFIEYKIFVLGEKEIIGCDTKKCNTLADFIVGKNGYGDWEDALCEKCLPNGKKKNIGSYEQQTLFPDETLDN